MRGPRWQAQPGLHAGTGEDLGEDLSRPLIKP
jgi:hypothetical protein